MPFLLVEILNFQGSTHLIGVGSLSNVLTIAAIGGTAVTDVGNSKFK